MSIEAMSGGSAVGIATTINTGPAISSLSLGTAPDIGGTDMPGFDSNALFETFEMPTPSLEFPEVGKRINISPFKDTRVLWQAQTDLITKPAYLQTDKALQTSINVMPTDDIKISDRVIQQINEIPDPIFQLLDIPDATILSEPEIKLSPVQEESAPNLNSEIENFVQEIFLDPETQIGKAIPIQEQQTEVIADAQQAVKVEEALMSVGRTKEEAHEVALRIFKETESKKGLMPELKAEKLDIRDNKTKTPELYFEHDTKADEARKKAATSAIETVSKEIADGEKKAATGHDIVKHMPNPEPQEVKSEIAKDRDGSYENLIAELEAIREISSTAEAADVIDGIISDNHAVRATNVLKTQKATEGEIIKVLKTGGVIFQNKP